MSTFIFPGQGSQSIGMGGGLFDEFKELMRVADEVLGFSIKQLCDEDLRKELNNTRFTQPALYVTNALSYFKEVKDNGKKPNYLVGHSLGEINALLAAECFDFETGLKIVKKRGELMSQAEGGSMAAILNSSEKEVLSVLERNNLNTIDIANYNTPSQIVISGLKSDMTTAQRVFEKVGVMYFSLNTSGAFHSRYMQAPRQEFEAYLKQFSFSDLSIPVISNVSAKPHVNGLVKECLVSQLIRPVQWSKSIQYLIGLGETGFKEIGHGEVLTKLVVKIQQEMPNAKTSMDGVPQVQSLKKDIERVVEANRERGINTGTLTAKQKAQAWNQKHPVGTKVKSSVVKGKELETRTKALVLFEHRAAVYLKGFKGYFDLDETVAV